MNKQTYIEQARELRKNQTESEIILWRFIRKRQIDNKKFLRQHPIVYSMFNNKPEYYIADFYCAESKLIIELDGEIHNAQKEYDEQRDYILKEKGYKVVRFKNEELKEIENVLNRIKECI